MGDLKNELRKIRGKVKAKPPDQAQHEKTQSPKHKTPAVRKKTSKPTNRGREQGSHSDRALKVLESMPLVGRVVDVHGDRGFGLVETATGNKLFHVTHRLTGKSAPLQASLYGQQIYFALGSSPRSRQEKLQAISWCPVSDAALPTDQELKDADEYGSFRRKWLSSLALGEVCKILEARWYRKIWHPLQPPTNLADALLERRVLDLMLELETDELLAAELPTILARSPYQFAAWWTGAPKRLLDFRFLKELPVEKLLCLGAPSPDCLESLSGEALVKAGSWGLMQDDEAKRTKFLKKMNGQRPEEAGMAKFLMSKGWRPSVDEVDWLQRLKKAGHFDSSTIMQALEREPQSWRSWYPILDESEKQQVYSGRFCTLAELVEFLEDQTGRAALEALASHTVSIDLETDGDTVREIGVSRWGVKPELYRAEEKAITAGQDALRSALEGAVMVVGHNIASWDLPIIERLYGIAPAQLVWDTLLVQSILTPWSPTLSLGGSHSADQDALLALQLFVRQLEELPRKSILDLLGGKIQDSFKLISMLAEQVGKIGWWVPDPAPEVEHAVAAARTGRNILAEPAVLRKFDWIQRLAVVAAVEGESLHQDFWAVSKQKLKSSKVSGLDPVKSEALLAILQIADSQEIAVRFNMLPFWLRTDGDPEFLGWIRGASFCPERDQEGWAYISPLPEDIRSLAKAKDRDWTMLSAPMQNMVSASSGTQLKSIPDFARQAIGPRETELAGGSKGCIRCFDPDSNLNCWLYPDRVAIRLKKSAGFYEYLAAVPATNLSVEWIPTPEGSPPPRVLVPTPSSTALYPNSLDPQTYWIELLDRFRQLVPEVGDGSVPILLIGSTSNHDLRTMLESALVEQGMAELPELHHGRAERLRRARTRSLSLVDFVGNWEVWLELGMQMGIPVVPFLEVLPIERFFVEAHEEEGASSEKLQREEGLVDISGHDGEEDADEHEDQDEPLPRPTADSESSQSNINWWPQRTLLTAIPFLIRHRMLDWLNQRALAANAEGKVFVLDSRVCEVASRLIDLVEPIAGTVKPISAELESSLRINFESLAIERLEPPNSIAELESFLVQNWNAGRTDREPNYIHGFRRQTQIPAIDVIRTRSTHIVVSLPTGEGKSILFQVPALSRGLRNRRLTLVLSPLKALMKDQFLGLERQGFGSSVGYLSSDQTQVEINETLQGVLEHRIVLLYIAPERFKNSRFFDVLQRRALLDGGLEYVVFDEAHCISQWGYQFRPDYFQTLQVLREDFSRIDPENQTPFLFFSATLTQNDRNDLARLVKSGDSKKQDENPDLRFVPEDFNDPVRDFIEFHPRRVYGGFNPWRSFEDEVRERLDIIMEECEQMLANRQETRQHSSMIVFVSRRYHAEMLAALIGKKLPKVRAGFYHAGMDEQDREDIYEGFQSEKIDVLVATKAFGMGMDIPHIHWAIHLSPPSYLEDYLQEVGRIGRGLGERQSAGLENLRAVLIHSEDDFATNRELRARGEINFDLVRSWFESIANAATLASNDQAVAVIPEGGFAAQETEAKERAIATELRMCLFWLEKVGKLEVVGTLPSILPATMNLRRIRELADEKTSMGRVAGLLLKAHAVQWQTESKENQFEKNRETNGVKGKQQRGGRSRQGGILTSMLDILGSVVSLFFPGRSTSESNRSARESTSKQRENRSSHDPGIVSVPETVAGLINIGQILSEGEFEKIDGVLEDISKLEDLSALKLDRMLRIKSKDLACVKSATLTEFLNAIQKLSAHVLSGMASKGKVELDWEDLTARFQEFGLKNEVDGNWSSQFKKGTKSCLRGAGVRIYQSTTTAGAVVEFAHLPKTQVRRAKGTLDATIGVAKRLLKAFHGKLQEREAQVELGEMVRTAASGSPNRHFSKALFWKALWLLSSVSIMTAPRELLPRSYLVCLDPREGDLTEEEFSECNAELKQVNELAEQRIHSMEIFANLPEDVRLPFVREYFKADGVEDLKQVMESMLPEIESEDDAGDWISRMRDSIREESASVEMRKFKEEPEEPNQWKAIARPARSCTLVNAGPGSGKTAVLLARVFYLIREQGVLPEQILVLAFNRAVVFELRSRLQALFRTLGYPRYVRRLRIHTFHGFAMRHLPIPDDGDFNSHRESLLQNLAQTLKVDSRFAQELTLGLRAILVDEFQDVDDDIFSILTALKSAAGPEAGIFVIGDDDQDILRWSRRNKSASPKFSDDYFIRFMDTFGLASTDQLSLRVNFRSDAHIVERSQNFIDSFFGKLNGQTRRMKSGRLTARREAGAGHVNIQRLDAASMVSMQDLTLQYCQKEIDRAGIESIAVLCRTNAEVAEHYINLQAAIQNVTLQAGTRVRLSELRHLGMLADSIRALQVSNGDQYLTEDLTHSLCKGLEASGAAEFRFPRVEDLTPSHVFDLARKEYSRPSLSNVIELLDGTDLDEAERILGLESSSGRFIVVSTINKVKGLEFDSVLIVSSECPIQGKDGDEYDSELADLAAEEARLYYVGMTRAKKRLKWFFGPREDAWWNARAYEGIKGGRKMLVGTHNEVAISWAMQENRFNSDAEACQEYIEREVCVGDPISLGGAGMGGGRALIHRSRSGRSKQIGFLSNETGAGGAGSQVMVSAVIRFRCNDENDRQEKWGTIPESILSRGWGYTVLVTGILEK